MVAFLICIWHPSPRLSPADPKIALPEIPKGGHARFNATAYRIRLTRDVLTGGMDIVVCMLNSETRTTLLF